jgi:hypothetical protein
MLLFYGVKHPHSLLLKRSEACLHPHITTAWHAFTAGREEEKANRAGDAREQRVMEVTEACASYTIVSVSWSINIWNMLMQKRRHKHESDQGNILRRR